MKLENISEQEKRNVIVNELGKNMFVEAGAGAGKTIIVTRILHQLMAGVHPGEIVAITFTNAATRELKGRILATAFDIVNHPEKYPNYQPEQREALKKALDELDQMQISTIHSFCYRILSEKTFEAGLPFGVRLAEEDEVEALRKRYFKLWAEGLTREDWAKLLPARNGSRYNVMDSLNLMSKQLLGIPEDYESKIAVEIMSETDAKAKLDPILKEVCDAITQVVNDGYGRAYADLSSVDSDCLSAQGKSFQNCVNSDDVKQIMNALLAQNNNKAYALNQRGITIAVMKGMNITDKESQNAHKDGIQEDDNSIRELVNSKRSEVLRIKAGLDRGLFESYIDYGWNVRAYVKKRIDADLLTNNSLLEKTRDLLRKSDAVRRFLGERFKTIYVDEFQDTDHMQDEFIRKLASKPENPEELRDGALFVVGDPKQSIYRFRGAEPEVYFETKKIMQDLENACVVELSDNYRSNQDIIQWVNTVFNGKSITPGQDYVPMNTGHPLPEDLPENLFHGVFKYQSPEVTVSAEGALDEEVVSKLILSLMNGGKQIAEYDKKSNGYQYRPIQFSDFLILCANTKKMSDYADSFRKYGIPYVMDSKRNIKSDHDLAAFIRWYAFLADPMSKAAREGALEVLALSGADDGEKNALILDAMADETKDMSAYGCIKYLMKRWELYLTKEKDVPDYDVYDVQKKIAQMTEAMEAGNYGNRTAVLEAMQAYREKELEHELLLEKDTNAIRFMNLHKAKGLEGNIVIWTNRIEGRTFSMGAYRKGTEFYPSVSYTSDNHTSTLWAAGEGDEDMIAKAQKEEESEQIRKEYVAATRAKQALIFMDRYKESPGNYFSNGYDLDSLPSVEAIVQAYTAQTNVNVAQTISLQGWRTNEKQDLIFSSESPSQYEDESAGKAGRNATARSIPVSGGLRRPYGNVFGKVMHRTFELIINRWDCYEKLPAENLEAWRMLCVRQAVREMMDDIAEGDAPVYEAFLKEAAREFTEWFHSSELCKNAEKFYAELPFSFVKERKTGASVEDAREEDASKKIPVWMHGEADLVIQLKDGSFHVIDYKSDIDRDYPTEEAFEERLRGKYAPQVNAYREAVSRCFGVKQEQVKTTVLSFSQKDVMPGKKLRVRATEIVAEI